VSWSEVGIIQLDANLSDNNYLGSGNDVTGTVDHVGRFIPDRFTLSDNDPAFRDGTPVWGSPFTYMGQRFTYDTASSDADPPEITVTAVNVDDSTTQNYGGEGTGEDFWKLDTPARTYKDGTSGKDATFDDMPGTPTWNGTRGDYDGKGTLTLSGDEFSFARMDAATKQIPFDALVELTLASGELKDSDDACFDRADDGNCEEFTFDGDGDGDDSSRDPIGTNGNSTELRYGRLVVENANGAEIAPVEMPLRVEFWNNNQTWQVNDDDSTTELTLDEELWLTTNEDDGKADVADDDTVWGDQTIELEDFDSAEADGPCETSVDESGDVSMTNGRTVVTFEAPQNNCNGWVAALPLLGGDGNDEHSFLQYDWGTDDGQPNVFDDVLDDDPRGRVTFGIFRGNDQWIHIRRVR